MSEPASPRQLSSVVSVTEPATLSSGRPLDIRQSPSNSSTSSRSSSSSSTSSEAEVNAQDPRQTPRRSRIERPTMADRQRSQSIIISKGTDVIQRERPNYPPHDARAMSPRRSSVDLERLEKNARKCLRDQARTLQSSLAALAERIDEVRFDHDKLESENRFLQDYIGGLTRTMSGTGLGRSGSTMKKSKK